MRIIAGRHKGRTLLSPQTRDVRPTSDRAREAIFNILEHAEYSQGIEGMTVLDAFAGSGAIGLEALSRGASRAIFFERDRTTIDLAKQNAAKLGELPNTSFFAADAANPPRATIPADVIFLDPPYRSNLTTPVWQGLAATGWLTSNSLVISETAAAFPDPLPDEAAILDSRRYGVALVRFLKIRA